MKNWTHKWTWKTQFAFGWRRDDFSFVVSHSLMIGPLVLENIKLTEAGRAALRDGV